MNEAIDEDFYFWLGKDGEVSMLDEDTFISRIAEIEQARKEFTDASTHR